MGQNKNMNKTNHAKFAFYYLLSLVALIFMAISSGIILFQFVNKFLPDIYGNFGTDFSIDALRFAIAAIIVATPIFYIVSRLIYQALFKGELEKDAGIRRWLTYFILLVASVTIIGFLIATILSFLNGELTWQFVLKTIIVVGISATAFTFYLYDIRRDEVINKTNQVIKIYTYATLIFIIAVFIASLFILESPAAARDRRKDETVVGNLNQISNDINNYYLKTNKLPVDLETVKADIGFNEDIYSNSLNKEVYKYEIIASSSYKLCATFLTSNLDKTNSAYRYLDDSQRHNKGYDCLKFKIYGTGIKAVPTAVQ